MDYVKGTLADPCYVDARRAHATYYSELVKREIKKVHRVPPLDLTKTLDQHFYRAAEICREHGWGIELYVRSMFDIAQKNKYIYITPKDLTRETTVEAFHYIQQHRLNQNDPNVVFHNQVVALTGYLASGTSERDVLLSPMTPFTEWFRVCYPEVVDPEIMEYYGRETHAYLFSHPALRSAIKAARPKTYAALVADYGPLEVAGTKGGYGL